MRSYFTLLIIISLLIQGISQPVKFNLTFSSGKISRNILELDTIYISVGSGGAPQKINVTCIDTNGSYLWSKDYGDSTHAYYHGAENSLNSLYDHYFLAGSKSGLGFESCYLVWFDEQFDTIKTNIYLYDTMQSVFYGGSLINDHLLLTGFTQLDSQGLPMNNSDLLLIKTDTFGNLIWRKNLGGIESDFGNRVLETFEGNFLIGGWSQSFNTQTPQMYDRGDWYLVKTDTAGNMLWQDHYGHPDYEDGRIGGLIRTKDSCYAVCGMMATSQPFLNYTVYRGCIMKMDMNMNVLWDRKYDPETENTGIINIIEEDDSSMTAIGYTLNYLFRTEGRMFHLDNDGNILWHRRYKAFGSDTSMSQFLTLAKTRDKGYIISGTASNSSASPSQQIWVVKTDSLGCDGTGSCADTALYFNVSAPDTICFGDTTLILFSINGRSAPYQIGCDNGWYIDSIYYPFSGEDVIDTVCIFLPAAKDTTYSLEYTLNDPWGATVVTGISIYVKDCGNIIKETHGKNDLRIYPNPAGNKIKVLGQGQKQIVMTDLSGKELIIQSYNTSETELDVSGLARGIYIVKVVTEKGVVSEKVILQ